MSWTASSLIVHKRRWITHHWWFCTRPAQVYNVQCTVIWCCVCVCVCVCVRVCVYLSVGAQRYASSSWFEPQPFLRSPVAPQWDCQPVPSLCGHSHPTYKKTHQKNCSSWLQTTLCYSMTRKRAVPVRVYDQMTTPTWKNSSCFSGLQKNGCLSTQAVEGRDSGSVLIICSIRSCAMTSSDLRENYFLGLMYFTVCAISSGHFALKAMCEHYM